MSGIEREIDDVGRVVIPMEFRKALGVEFNSKVLISLLPDKSIVIRAKKSLCALCGNSIEGFDKIRLCQKCIDTVKNIY